MSDLKLFINRKQEISFLKHDLSIIRSISRFLLISANTGIGKSALVDRIMKDFVHENYRVVINIDKTNGIQDGYLIKQITKLIHSNAIKNPSSSRNLYEFIKSDRFYGNVANGLIKVIEKYIGLDGFLEGFDKKNQKTIDSLHSWMGDDNELIEICYKYILSVAEVKKLYIVIENFQIVDRKSLLYIRDLLISTPNIYMIGEYTIVDGINEISEYLDLFGSENIEVHNFRLEKIDKQELISSIKDEKDILIGIIERTYENSDGNLHKFKLLRNTNHLRNYDINIATYNNVTKHLLNSLDDISLALISIIQAHQGELGRELLSFYIRNAPSFQFVTEEDYAQKLISLKELGLIEIQTNLITLKHDSISLDIQDVPKAQRLQTIVIRDWIRIYQLFERNASVYDIDYVDNLLWQIYFMLKTQSFDEIAEVLEKLNKYISISPTHTIIFQLDKIAEAYKKYVSEEYNTDIFKWLIVMYYQCGYFDKVVNIATPMLLTDHTILLCFLASLSTISHSQTFEYLDNLTYTHEPQLTLGLILVKIRTLRSADRLEECLNLWYEHYEKGTFKNTFYEGSFFKYSSLAIHDDYDFRLDCLKRAMELFNLENDKYGKIGAAIALSRDSAYIGNIEQCQHYLKQAEDLANLTVFPRYTLYNNRAMLDVISNNISKITKDGLNNSLRICTNEGDLLIIQSNILVIAIIERDNLYGYTIYNKLQKYVLANFNEGDTIIQICLYNCYRYALMIGEIDQANYLKDFLEKTIIKQDHELWHYLLYDRGANKYTTVVKKEYYPIFMIGWDIDYYNVLNNYQQEAVMHQ